MKKILCAIPLILVLVLMMQVTSFAAPSAVTVADSAAEFAEVSEETQVSEENSAQLSTDSLTTVASGTCGTNLTWTLDSAGTLTISGTGAMTDYLWDDSPWYSYKDSVINVIFDTGVTTVGEYAFYKFSKIQSVTFSDTITLIGEDAFYKVTGISELIIPNSVQTIGIEAFRSCEALKKLVINDATCTISQWAFAYCYNLEEIDFGKKLKVIREFAFGDCKSLKTLFFPSTLTLIESSNYGAFEKCTNLESVVFDNSPTAIGSNAFYGCWNLKSVSLGSAITSIGSNSFYGCKISTIDIPETTTNISVSAIDDCDYLQSINVHSNNKKYKSIDGVLFDYDLKTIMLYPSSKPGSVYEIPYGVVQTGNYSLQNKFLESVIIPETLTSIGSYSFCDCSKLSSIAMPKSVATIGDSAFARCTSLIDTYYGGSKYDWNKISIHYNGNSKLVNSSIHFLGFSDDSPGEFTGEALVTYDGKNYDLLAQPVYIFKDALKDVEVKIDYRSFWGYVKIYLAQNEEQIVEIENGVAKQISISEEFPLSADYKTPDANTPADVYIHIVNETTGETKIWPTKLKILSDESRKYLSPESATEFIKFLTTNNAYTPDESHAFYGILTGNLHGRVKYAAEQAFLAYAYDALGTDVYDNRLNAILDFFADDVSLELKDALYDIVVEEVHEKLLNVGEINDLNDVKTGLKVVLGAIAVVAYERDKEEHAYFRTILGVDQNTEYFEKLKLGYPTCKRADMIDDWALFVYEIEQKLALEYKNAEAVSPSAEYQLTFVSNCEDIEDYTYTYDPSKNNWHIPSMTREGYIFGGWYWDAECTSCATGVSGVNWDATFYANWIKRYYDVTLESNCDIIDDKVITVDITIGYIIKDLQRNGYAFAGWYKDQALTIAAPYELNPTSDMTLYAKWKPLFSYSVCDDEIFITGLLAYVVNDGIEDKNIIIPQTIDGYKVTSIADDAFKNTSITGATVEEGVTSIGANAFSGCSDMTFIYLPLSISSIGNSAFYGCEKLSIQGYPGTYTETYAKQEGISFVALTPTHRTFYTKMWAYLNLESEVTMSVGYKFEYMVDIIPEEHLDRMGLLMWDYASTPEESEAIYENCSNIIAGARYNSADERFETTTDGIAAKNLGDQLSFRAYYLNDDGSYTYSKLISNYSPKTYCYNKINDEPDDEKNIALMVSILNYGAAAQTYFGYNTDNLMNSELSEEQKKITWDGTLVRSDYSIPDGKDSAFVRDASITSRGGYLNLEGAIDYNFYAKTDSMDPYGATIYYWTEEDISNLDVLTFANASSFESMTWNESLERYEGKYEGCAAKEMFNTVYACIVFSSLFGDDDINSGVIGYSPERYAYINQDKEDRNGMLCKYMVIYGDAARSYFAERN